MFVNDLTNLLLLCSYPLPFIVFDFASFKKYVYWFLNVTIESWNVAAYFFNQGFAKLERYKWLKQKTIWLPCNTVLTCDRPFCSKVLFPGASVTLLHDYSVSGFMLNSVEKLKGTCYICFTWDMIESMPVLLFEWEVRTLQKRSFQN